MQTDTERRTAERLAQLLEDTGLSRDVFASMVGREPVTIHRYLNGGVISKKFCAWLDRVEEVHVYEGGARLTVKMSLTRRQYNAVPLPVTVRLSPPLRAAK